MAGRLSYLATIALVCSAAFAVVLPKEANAPSAPSEVYERADDMNSLSDDMSSADIMPRSLGIWKSCSHKNATSEWGEVFSGCHDKHGATEYLDATSEHQFDLQVRSLLNQTLALPVVMNKPRYLCTREHEKRLCVSWANDITNHVEPAQLEMAAEKSMDCIMNHGYSTEVALWSFSGERVFVCISDRPRHCKPAICR